LLGVSLEELSRYSPAKLDEIGGVMLKDESTCIRCGMCASRCPSHAITMQRFVFERMCISAPVPNPGLLYNIAGR
jgi:ferredoxin